MSIAPTEAPVAILNASHRCDRCGARAFVVFILRRSPKLKNGGELLFCVHHARRYDEALIPLVTQIIDESQHLREHIRDDKHVN